MSEKWAPIVEFPYYKISTHGRVLGDFSNTFLKPQMNAQGILYVRLHQDRVSHTRAISKLVADAFLEPHENPNFDTPTHLDGDKTNCHVDNLFWQPRWFAVKYHRQFKDPFPYPPDAEVIETGSETIYKNAWVAAVTLGCLCGDVMESAFNDEYVPRTLYRFAWLDDYMKGVPIK